MLAEYSEPGDWLDDNAGASSIESPPLTIHEDLTTRQVLPPLSVKSAIVHHHHHLRRLS